MTNNFYIYPAPKGRVFIFQIKPTMKKHIFITALFLTVLGIHAQSFSDGMITAKPGATDKNGVYYYAGLDEKPDFPDRKNSFQKQISNKVSTDAYKNSSGTDLNIVLSFIIEKDGSITNAEVLNKHTPTTIKEAIDAIKAIKTKWIAGKYKGKPVRSGMVISVLVPIHKNNKPYKESAMYNNVQIVEVIPASSDLDRGVEIPDSGQDKENAIYVAAGLQVSPEFPGGIKALQTFVTDNINKEKLPAGTGGKDLKVFATFVVEKDGTITAIRILRDPGYGIGKETERVLKLVKTKWSPGIQNGKAVRAQYNLPVTIKMAEGPSVGQKTDETVNEKIYFSDNVQVVPLFPGGKEAFITEINKRIQRGKLESEVSKKELRISINFMVEKDGSLTDLTYINTPSKNCWDEVQAAIKDIKTKWSPGVQNGKPVRVSYSMEFIIRGTK